MVNSGVMSVFRFVGAVLLEAAAMVSRTGVFMALVLALGIGSSLYLSSRPSALTATVAGPWASWVAAGRPEADPYTKARFAQLGSLVANAASIQTFEARSDEAGQRLHSSCDYLVEGGPFEASWWSVAVYTENGQLIANPINRHAFTSKTIAMSPNGRFLISLSREAHPGNWLPTRGAGRLVIVLTLHQPQVQTVSGETPVGAGVELPTIRRLACG